MSSFRSSSPSSRIEYEDDLNDQIMTDEEYARKLQQEEDRARRPRSSRPTSRPDVESRRDYEDFMRRRQRPSRVTEPQRFTYSLSNSERRPYVVHPEGEVSATDAPPREDRKHRDTSLFDYMKTRRDADKYNHDLIRLSKVEKDLNKDEEDLQRDLMLLKRDRIRSRRSQRADIISQALRSPEEPQSRSIGETLFDVITLSSLRK